MMKSFCFLATMALACLASLASARAAERITVAAAADLKFAMDEIIASFKASHSADEIGVTYGSSGNLSTRIQQGAPFDIFFSADVGFARALKDKGLAATEPKLYAVGRIVLWSAVRDASKMSLRDLDDPRIRGVAIANLKHAPYGRRAEEALRALGLWDRLQNKIVFGENIVHTAKYVQSGAVEMGIIALSLAVNRELASKGGYALIADNLHSPLEQAYVITKQGREKPLAKAFAAYLENPDARRIMIKYGFVLPSDSAAPQKPEEGLLTRTNQLQPPGSLGKQLSPFR